MDLILLFPLIFRSQQRLSKIIKDFGAPMDPIVLSKKLYIQQLSLCMARTQRTKRKTSWQQKHLSSQNSIVMVSTTESSWINAGHAGDEPMASHVF